MKALRVVKDYIAEMEKKGKKVLMLCMMSSHGFIAKNEQGLKSNIKAKHTEPVRTGLRRSCRI